MREEIESWTGGYSFDATPNSQRQYTEMIETVEKYVGCLYAVNTIRQFLL